MFDVNYKGQALRVVFSYPQRRTTSCRILKSFTNRAGDKVYSVVHEGVSNCLSDDQFEKNTGRKTALRNVLNKHVPRNERVVFWEAYFKERHGTY